MLLTIVLANVVMVLDLQSTNTDFSTCMWTCDPSGILWAVLRECGLLSCKCFLHRLLLSSVSGRTVEAESEDGVAPAEWYVLRAKFEHRRIFVFTDSFQRFRSESACLEETRSENPFVASEERF